MAKKISVGTWAYIWGGYADKPINLPVVANKLQEYKFDGVELGIFAPHLSLDEAKDLNKVREVKKLLDDHGLAVSGIAADFGKVPPMLASMPDYLDTVLRHVESASPRHQEDAHGHVVPATDPGGMDFETASGARHAFARRPRSPGRTASTSSGSSARLPLQQPSEVVRMCYAVGHKNFGVLFDSCHAHMCAVVGRARWARRRPCPAASSSSPICSPAGSSTSTSLTAMRRCTMATRARKRRSARASSTSRPSSRRSRRRLSGRVVAH